MGARFAGVLESSLYFDRARREEVLDFYRDVLGLRQVASFGDGTAFRIGGGVLLLFEREGLAGRDEPMADHGADGPGHVCLLAGTSYDAAREELRAAGVAITHEHEWTRGRRSFYFRDPQGNLLEVAEGDIWPE